MTARKVLFLLASLGVASAVVFAIYMGRKGLESTHIARAAARNSVIEQQEAKQRAAEAYERKHRSATGRMPSMSELTAAPVNDQ